MVRANKAHAAFARRGLNFFSALLLLALGCCSARAAIQFDVFLGYDGIVPEASWFPVVCEIKNDGPGFKGVVELSGSTYNQGQTVRAPIELPTGTLKRLVLPVFSSSRGYISWDLRLLDERGRTRAEQTGMRPRKLLARATPILGALSRTAGGTPAIRPVLSQSSELQPAAARILPAIFPDNPLVLEGMSCLYLNSERAADLTLGQVNAILAWLNIGGHLIIAIEQPSDVTASPWLRSIVPLELKDVKSMQQHPELQDWLRKAPQSSKADSGPNSSRRYGVPRFSGSGYSGGNIPSQSDIEDFFQRLPLDLDFEAASLPVAVGSLRTGKVEISSGDVPLMVSAGVGRGKVTVLLFSPEREPMRSWKQLDLFWARLVDVPPMLYVSKDFNVQGGWSSDGIFGAMIDTRQVHKLPIGWLLLLLLVYLVVIGPLDQYWLKRIGKPMLTWITFPCYVVVFSLVIYFIGYKLRAGESEWNELHIVDILKKGEEAELRGRTYSSVYSPSNQRYTLDSQQRYATLRGEFAGFWGGGQTSDKATVVQKGDSFAAEVFVPVWTSELYVSDWWQPAAVPLQATVRSDPNGWQVSVQNRTEHRCQSAFLVIDHKVVNLGEIPANQTRSLTVTSDSGTPLSTFVSTQGGGFQQVVMSRQRALGASERGQINDLPNASVASSFLSQLYRQQNENQFVVPPGLDLAGLLERDQAVVLAWSDNFAPVKPMYQFSPRRSQTHTLWRISVPIQ